MMCAKGMPPEGETVGWFDDAEVQRVKQEKESNDAERRLREHQKQAEHAELMDFTIQGLMEFPAAARSIGLPTEKREIGHTGLRPKTVDGWLLMTSVFDNSYLYRYWVDVDGGVWMDTTPSDVQKIAAWLAKSCDYRTDAIRQTLTAALAGVPLTKAY